MRTESARAWKRSGPPKDYYTVEEAGLAVDDAEQIYTFCKLSVH